MHLLETTAPAFPTTSRAKQKTRFYPETQCANGDKTHTCEHGAAASVLLDRDQRQRARRAVQIPELDFRRHRYARI